MTYAQQREPDAVFSAKKIYPGTLGTGPNPEVIYSGGRTFCISYSKSTVHLFEQPWSCALEMYFRMMKMKICGHFIGFYSVAGTYEG
jgi:hypothetical protein